MWQSKELVGCTVGYNVGVNVDNFGELSEFPEVYFRKGRVKVRAVHQIQVGRVFIAYARDGEDVIVYGLRRTRISTCDFALRGPHLDWSSGISLPEAALWHQPTPCQV